MTSSFTYNGIDLGTASVRLGSIGGLTEQADQGQMGVSSLAFDDPTGAGADILLPHRAFYMSEDACSDIRAYSGYSTQRTYERADSLRTGAAERINVSFVDLNASFSFKVIHHGTFHYKRPAETDIERIDWVRSVSTGLMDLADHGLIDRANPRDMSAVDYTGQFPMQVLQDCADLSGKNFFCYYDEASGDKSLAYFKSRDVAFYPSTLSISNVPSDWSSTCFGPAAASLERDPSEVYDGVLLQYSGGEVYQRSTGAILPRDVVAPSSNTSSRQAAINLATRFLAAAADEAERVTCTIRVPASQVNLLRAGMMVNARFTYMSGWDPGIDVRVLQRTIKQDILNPDFYDLELIIGHSVITNFTIGPGGDNSRVWPSDLPPFRPDAGEFAFVQSAKTPNSTLAAPTATYGTMPVEGNLLVALLLVRQPGFGSPPPSAFSATFPTGWSLALGPVGDSSDGRLNAIWVAWKIAEASEPTTVAPVVVEIATGSPQDGYLVLGEYSSGGEVTLASVDLGVLTGPSNNGTIPTLTPPAGQPTLMVLAGAHEPDYFSTYSTGWVNREETEQGGPRQALALVDQIVTAASGAYTGVATVPGIGESMWFLSAAVFTATGAEPAIGQSVAPESAVSDGSRVLYQTNYPYIPGSLVVKINGATVANVEETDPTTGLFTLPAAPATGAIITWTYSVADQTPTGANNPPPPSNPPGIPPDPGTVPGGDGVYRQPQQEYVPAETPDGIITVFTIVPYIAGNTLVYINGLIQRKGIDWNELSPAAGTIEFTSPPWTGATITVTAMPVTAAPTGSGFGNPSLYGPGINADTKANLQNNATVVAHRFRSIGGVLDTVRWQQRGGTVYSAGTGGTYNITVEADAAGVPSGTPLSTQAYTPGNPGGDWTHYDEVTFSSPATLVAGTLYHIVFTNTHGTPASNYVSVNELFLFGSSPLPAGAPRQPKFPDTDWAVLYGGVLQSRYTADMDLGYAGGAHQGMGYIQLMTAQYGTISGATNMVREAITVSGPNRTVTTASVRVRRSSGSAPLTVRLETGAGTLIEQVDVPASLVPISAAGSDNGGSAWVGVRFLAPHVLTSGQSYNLRLSCASGTTYTAAPIRKGTTEGMDPDTVFMDGAGQFTTNSGGTWTDLYTFDTDPPDLQMYFGVTT